MNLPRRYRRRVALPFALALSIASLATVSPLGPSLAQETAAADLAERTPDLVLGIPSDVLLAVHSRRTPGLDAYSKEIDGLLDALASPALLESVTRGLVAQASPVPEVPDGLEGEEAEAARARVEEAQRLFESELESWTDALRSVDWRTLTRREVAVVLRYDVFNEVLALFRVDPTDRARLTRQLSGLLEEIVVRGEDFELVRAERRGVRTLIVQSRSSPEAQMCLGGFRDVIAVSTSAKLLRRSLNLLSGRSSARGLAIDPLYDESLGALPGRDDAVLELLVNPPAYFDPLRGAVEFLERNAGPRDGDAAGGQGEDDERDPAAGERLRRAIEADRERVQRARRFVDAFDCVRLKAMRVHLADGELRCDALVRLRDSIDKSLLARTASKSALPAPARFVPEGTKSYFAWSGLDFARGVAGVDELAESGVLDGDISRRLWRWISQGLDRELLAALDGELIVLGSGTGGGALLARLADTAKARAALERLAAADPEGAALLRLTKLEGEGGEVYRLGPTFLPQLGLRVTVRDETLVVSAGAGDELAAASLALRAKEKAGDRTLEIPAVPGVLHGAAHVDVGALRTALEPFAPEGGALRPLLDALGLVESVDWALGRTESAYRAAARVKLRAQKQSF